MDQEPLHFCETSEYLWDCTENTKINRKSPFLYLNRLEVSQASEKSKKKTCQISLRNVQRKKGFLGVQVQN